MTPPADFLTGTSKAAARVLPHSNGKAAVIDSERIEWTRPVPFIIPRMNSTGGSSMCRIEYKSKRRKTVASIETLDERVVLSIFVPTPATPAPAASPFNAAMVRRFEMRIDRFNRAFLTQSRQLNAMVSQRAARLEASLAHATQM